jgi:hypothetical protein
MERCDDHPVRQRRLAKATIRWYVTVEVPAVSPGTTPLR